ncbi:HDL227Cp [Eremothecium sinecaudum]|uniref:HDL227Cp n=1 Tax=Eremothecium sinecaudum TaxID=45286 RepID=A0A0X8HS82_9SACH|nr:HDL227Cp [Eremothecium sinecaudum]AMD20517.1 HDL227Cp [Eremothecium sinecaudum]
MQGELKQRIPNSSAHELTKDNSKETKPKDDRKELIYKGLVHSKTELHTLLVSSSILTLLAICHIRNPKWCRKFVTLQYEYVTRPNHYDIGSDDAYIVITFVVILSLVRSFVLEFILKPVAYYRFNIRSTKALQKYGEQAWAMIYYTASWTFGFYLYCKSPYFLDCDALFIGWPHDQMTGAFKLYNLIQMSSWIQQIVVLTIEERRKDYFQMLAHHLITIALTTGSYYYYFTRIGHVILILMDFVDILLACAKVQKYCGFTVACDYTFMIFLVFWFALRHVIYNYLLYHTWFKSRTLMPEGECGAQLFQKRCWTHGIMNGFSALLAGLQVLTIIWFVLIIKVLMKVIKGFNAEDVRSDDEE